MELDNRLQERSPRRERREAEATPLYRNGYEPGRLLIGEGLIEVQRPQVRGGGEPYRSRVWELLGQRSEGVERLVVEMYARGLSRDIEDLFRGESGEVKGRSPDSDSNGARLALPGDPTRT